MEDKKTTVKKENDKKVVRRTRSNVKEKLIEENINNINESQEVREVVVEKKAGFNYAEVIVIMIIMLIIGSMIGSFITFINRDTKKIITNGDNVTKVPSELTEFVDTYNNIVNDYYQDVNTKELLEAGINGMLQYLGDDYSVYMNQTQTDSFNEQVEGKYTGIGVEITLQENGGVKITRVFENSPAYDSGLKVGDIFVSVDGEDVTTKNASDISTMIKGSKTGKVNIIVDRNGEKKQFNLVLKQVDIESVTTKIFENNNKKIGYIDLSIFASNTFTQFERKILELEGKNIDSLIIDVRDNSGGYLSTVTDIASLFMNKNKIIYQLDTKGVVEQVFSKTNTNRKYDIIVLINKNSASASEILAGALQESYGAKIVGVNSFGKGTVQKAYQLQSGATVKYTVQKWLTPNGNWINGVGITPDIVVELDNNYYMNPCDETDTQLQKAIQELSK